MKEHETCVGNNHPTIVSKQLRLGEAAPDFSLDYLDLVDMAVRTVGLADSTGMVRLLNVVSTLERPFCQCVTRRWEALSAHVPPNACIYTISNDLPQMQAHWQEAASVLHQTLSAHRAKQFAHDYGIWLNPCHQPHKLQPAVFVIDRHNRIAYTEYIADQTCEPDYATAMDAVHLAALE